MIDKDNIETAWVEHAHGPGWSNDLVHVLVNEGGRRRVVTLQPDEYGSEFGSIMAVSRAVSEAMRALVWRNCKGNL